MKDELADLQKETLDFVRKNDLNEDIVSRVLDLASEVGELAKEVLIATNYGKRAFIFAPQFEEELGDVFFEVICIANVLDIDLEEAIHVTLQKMKRRITKNGHPGSSR